MRLCGLLLLILFICSLPGRADDLDAYLRGKGLMDVGSLDTTLCVQLVYATADNFMKQTVYSGISRAWLHPDAAEK